MKNTEKDRLNNQTEKRYLWKRFGNGCCEIFKNPIKLVILIAFPVLMLGLHTKYGDLLRFDEVKYVSPIFMLMIRNIVPILTIAGTVFLLILFGTPAGSAKFSDEFERIGFYNHAGEVPVLIARQKDKINREISIYEFDGMGIPLADWESKRQSLEAALNIHIVKLSEGRNKRNIQFHAVPASGQLSDCIEWNNSYLVQDSSSLIFGKSLTGANVKVNLSKIPHILLGGSTGSGKSVLLKLLLMQALKKNCTVSIADFKGGVDYPSVWHDKCRICFDEDSLILLLKELVDELEWRKTVFRETGCANLDVYNKQTGNNLQRHIFACDEVAEILDKTGLSKEQKEKVSQIESKLSVIARQGRAFGIHLILATQRPDATIISGQIRNNIDCRVCGRADNVLSQIILDSTAAADQIPKDAAGRFMLHDGTVFQAYWFDDAKLGG